MALSQDIKGTLNANGVAPIYALRAWASFNGTDTPSIIASGNVSSITDNGVGQYIVNFINPMPDNKYVALPSVSSGGGNTTSAGAYDLTVSNVKVYAWASSSSAYETFVDVSNFFVAIVR